MNSTDHNSNKYDTNTEANLLGNSVSYRHLKEKSKDIRDDTENKDDVYQSKDMKDKNVMETIMKNFDNLKTTETDMKFEYLANKDKLVPDDQLKYFEKPAHDYRHSETARSESRSHTKTQSESIKDYMKQPPPPQSTNEPPPRASSYGPSYGDGPSVAPPPTNFEDKYQGFASEEELNLAKLNMLRQLGELTTQHGVKLSQNYSMNSDYKAMKYEYELHKSIRDKHNGVKWLSNLMLNVCWGVELANENFNPFEFKLKGWSEQMNEDIDEYYDVLGELYEKYFKSGKPIPPELKLVLMIGGSAVKFHIANVAAGQIPTLGEALMNNPGLANKLNENKIKEQYEKQRKSFDKKTDEQHQMATKKADDLEMLRKKQEEFNRMNQGNQEQQYMQQQYMQQQSMQQQAMQQQLFEKHRQVEELQKQLNLQRSDARSMYTNNQPTMQMPNIPLSLKNGGFNQYNSGGIGTALTTGQIQEMNRQQQILDHKKRMQQDDRDDHSSVSIDKNIDNIIKNGFNETHSQYSEDRSKDSKGSKNSRRSRGRKPTIKINTR